MDQPQQPADPCELEFTVDEDGKRVVNVTKAGVLTDEQYQACWEHLWPRLSDEEADHLFEWLKARLAKERPEEFAAMVEEAREFAEGVQRGENTITIGEDNPTEWVRPSGIGYPIEKMEISVQFKPEDE